MEQQQQQQQQAIYDSIYDVYKQVEAFPFRSLVEVPSLFRVIGGEASIRDASVLDLACGLGFYSKLLKKAGAKQVVGVDASPKMIEVAKNEEAENPLGIEFRVGDAASMGQTEPLGKFDLVVAAFLLSYAKTKEELVQFAKGIYNNLKPGGRFVGTVDGDDNDPTIFSLRAKYGGSIRSDKPFEEGDQMPLVFHLAGGKNVEAMNTFWHLKTYEWAFYEAGFKTFAVRQPSVREDATEEQKEFMSDFVKHQMIVILEATK